MAADKTKKNDKEDKNDREMLKEQKRQEARDRVKLRIKKHTEEGMHKFRQLQQDIVDRQDYRANKDRA